MFTFNGATTVGLAVIMLVALTYHVFKIDPVFPIEVVVVGPIVNVGYPNVIYDGNVTLVD
jgi:hypothetical protein